MKQMKKFAALLLALAMVFALAACGGEPTPAATPTPPAPTEHVHTEEVIPGVDATCTEDGLTEGVRCSECGEILVEQEVIPALGHTTNTGTCERCGMDFGMWGVDYYVDNFNQPTDEWFITNANYYFEGTFNNSATVDSLLLVQAAYDLNNYITFFLYEYGSSLVVNSSNMYYEEYDITMRTPDGVDHPLTGKMYTGGDRIYIDDAYTDEVLTALRGEGDIMFYIVNSDRTVENYLVTIPASNFGELYDEMVQG